MAVEQYVGWSIYAVVGILIIGFAAWFVGHYKLRDEPSGVTGVIGFFSLLFALLSLFLIPIDVYMCSSYGEDNNYRSVAKLTYYVFYSIFLFCLFIAIPFGYFYYEELGDLQDRNNTFAKRACSALKYTAFSAILWITLIVIGLFVNFNSKTDTSANDEWTHKIADSFSTNVDGIMPFCIAVVTAIGMFFSMVYTAYGLAVFPISLMRPIVAPQSVNPKNLQIELKKISADLDMLYTKYRGRDAWPPRDKAKKNALERKKKLRKPLICFDILQNCEYAMDTFFTEHWKSRSKDMTHQHRMAGIEVRVAVIALVDVFGTLLLRFDILSALQWKGLALF